MCSSLGVCRLFSYVVYVGGNWNNEGNCGLWYLNCNNSSSNSNSNIGARLILYQNIKNNYTSFSTALAENKSLWTGLVVPFE